MSALSFLRPMDESDLAKVHEIEQACYDYPWTLSGFEKSLDQGLNYVFCDSENQIIGYSCILPVLDEAHLLNLCVSPKFQRQGIARQALFQLLDNLLDTDFKIVFLEVRESNEKARRLYGSLGFSEDGVRKRYYRCQVWDDEFMTLLDGKEDAVLMSYRFDG